MSFLKKLFGGGTNAPEKDPIASAPKQEYAGFTIHATPYPEQGQFQLCGVVSKEINGAMKSHRFIRADRFAAEDTAIEMTFIKARQLIDQQGERVFD